MLSADAVLDEEALRGILQAGHSRVPVHRPGSRWVCIWHCMSSWLEGWACTLTGCPSTPTLRSLYQQDAAAIPALCSTNLHCFWRLRLHDMTPYAGTLQDCCWWMHCLQKLYYFDPSSPSPLPPPPPPPPPPLPTPHFPT